MSEDDWITIKSTFVGDDSEIRIYTSWTGDNVCIRVDDEENTAAIVLTPAQVTFLCATLQKLAREVTEQ